MTVTETALTDQSVADVEHDPSGDERDELIHELTQRLAAAAEKLDRLHRMGLDRGQRVGGFPKEVVEEQGELVADLHRSVQMWEDMQSAAAFGRLEWQFSELREFVELKFAEADAAARAEEIPEDEEPATDAENSDELSESAANGEESLVNAESIELSDNERGNVCERDFVDPPPPIDLLLADAAELQSHMDLQDQFIQNLAGQLERTAAAPPSQVWEQFSGNADAWEDRLQEVDRYLGEMLRLTVYESQLQRQRLERKEALLRAKERQLQQRAAGER